MITITIQPQTPAHMQVLATALVNLIASDYAPGSKEAIKAVYAMSNAEGSSMPEATKAAPAPAVKEAAAKAAPKPGKAEKPASTPPVSETATTETTPAASAQTVPASESPSEPITLEQVRAKLTELSQGGKAAEVKALITAMGAAKLTDVAADKYPEMLEKAASL